MCKESIMSTSPIGASNTFHGTSGDDSVHISKADGLAGLLGLYEVNVNGQTSYMTKQQLENTNFELHGGNDTLVVDENVTADITANGGSGDDVIAGRGGNDELKGGRGDDVLLGGHGDDKLKGGRGDDVLLGGRGNDDLEGGRGDDLLLGGRGNDVLRGGRGDDALFGGRGHRAGDRGRGNDLLVGGQGFDFLLGGRGNDTIAP
jgi:Ca2+-binding RTX toxin-like protein